MPIGHSRIVVQCKIKYKSAAEGRISSKEEWPVVRNRKSSVIDI